MNFIGKTINIMACALLSGLVLLSNVAFAQQTSAQEETSSLAFKSLLKQ